MPDDFDPLDEEISPEEALTRFRRQYGDDFILRAAREIRKERGRGPNTKDDSSILEHMAALIYLGKASNPYQALKQTVAMIPHDYSTEATEERLRKKFRNKEKTFTEGAIVTAKLIKILDNANELFSEFHFFPSTEQYDSKDLLGAMLDDFWDIERFWLDYNESPIIEQKLFSLGELWGSVAVLEHLIMSWRGMLKWRGERAEEAVEETWRTEMGPQKEIYEKELAQAVNQLFSDIPKPLRNTFRELGKKLSSLGTIK